MYDSAKNFLRAPSRAFRAHFLDGLAWRGRQYAAPSPAHVKRQVLLRNAIPNAVWVETGTFLGETTRVLSRNARSVYSLEPEPALYARAAKKFAAFPNVKILNGTSEQIFPLLLPTLGDAVNFWLDGPPFSRDHIQGAERYADSRGAGGDCCEHR